MMIKVVMLNLNCLRCGKNSLLTDVSTGEQFCSKCGYVISETLQDSGPEWRSFQNDGGSNPARAGAPTSLMIHDMGLSTVINPLNKDASGKSLSAPMKTFLKRLRVYDSQSRSYGSSNRNLIQALDELKILKDKLTISSSIIEQAAYIYRKAVEKKLIKGRSISGVIAASLYAACRYTETPRTLKEIANASNVKWKDVARCYRLLYKQLELKVPVVDPIQFIAKISSKLEITEKTKRYAVKVIQEAQKCEESAGKDPTSLASAALYLSCLKNGISITQRELSKASGVTGVTLRNRCKGLKEAKILELDF